jgi:hypothetical protein
MSNLRIVTDPRVIDGLAAFFGQFERALPGFVPVMSEDDYEAVAINLDPDRGSKEWWDRLMRAMDGKRAAAEFRERMRAERNLEVA